MSTWVFDLGNTRLKYAEVGADGLPGEPRAIAHDGTGDWLRALPRGEVACVASTWEAQALGIADDGALRVRMGDGHERRVHAADVSVRA